MTSVKAEFGSDPAIDFPYRVSQTDPEVLNIAASTSKCDCSWRARLHWVCEGLLGYLPLDAIRDLAERTAALSTDNLAKEYFGSQGMLGYVKGVQRQEIRQGIACVKHQNMSGSDIGDDHKEYFAGEAALKAGGVHNTMNQFA